MPLRLLALGPLRTSHKENRSHCFACWQLTNGPTLTGVGTSTSWAVPLVYDGASVASLGGRQYICNPRAACEYSYLGTHLHFDGGRELQELG